MAQPRPRKAKEPEPSVDLPLSGRKSYAAVVSQGLEASLQSRTSPSLSKLRTSDSSYRRSHTAPRVKRGHISEQMKSGSATGRSRHLPSKSNIKVRGDVASARTEMRYKSGDQQRQTNSNQSNGIQRKTSSQREKSEKLGQQLPANAQSSRLEQRTSGPVRREMSTRGNQRQQIGNKLGEQKIHSPDRLEMLGRKDQQRQTNLTQCNEIKQKTNGPIRREMSERERDQQRQKNSIQSDKIERKTSGPVRQKSDREDQQRQQRTSNPKVQKISEREDQQRQANQCQSNADDPRTSSPVRQENLVREGQQRQTNQSNKTTEVVCVPQQLPCDAIRLSCEQPQAQNLVADESHERKDLKSYADATKGTNFGNTTKPSSPCNVVVNDSVQSIKSQSESLQTSKSDKDKPVKSRYFPPSSHVSKKTRMQCHGDTSALGYKRKYKTLLEYEEEEHQKILKESCNTVCTLELYESKSTTSDSQSFAFLSGLKDYQIAYAIQAAEVERKIGANISIPMNPLLRCNVHILNKNNSHTEQKLYIAVDKDYNPLFESHFKPQIMENGSVHVEVKFLVKSSYFRNLKKSVDSLPMAVIPRIQPCDRKVLSLEILEEECEEYMSQLDTEQFTALNAILGKTLPNSPPILISGPFGTGKTRVMAIAAHLLFQKLPKAQILLCTQQRESADNFMLMYCGVVSASGSNDDAVDKILLRDYGYKNPKLKRFYVSSRDLTECDPTSKLLIATTCLTAHFLQNLQGLQLTHIFIDEGAQMREPEAIAALRMANDSTKIVIAGDPKQVGPAMLVFGQEARDGGLDKSLLERLILEYKTIQFDGSSTSRRFHISLVTNYRCHQDILDLCVKLFYPDTHLRLPVETTMKPQVFEFRKSQSSIHFICSSLLKNKPEHKEEAKTIVDMLVEINKEWPRFGVSSRFDPRKVCIMSKTRSQLQTIYNSMIKKGVSEDLKRVRRVPTFIMQGSEYCVLLLSTFEHLNEDGSPCIDSSKSLCNPHVFNTAITRAESLVVAVGNPLLLLKTEMHMTKNPDYVENGKCWSNFLRHCIEHNTIYFSNSLQISEEERKKNLAKIKELVEQRLGYPVEHGSQNRRPHVTTLEKRFRPECELGRGGYGVVLKVKRLTDNHILAIKLKLCVKDEKKTQMEAKKLLELNHPNIVQYYDSGLAKRPNWSDWEDWLEKKSRFAPSSSNSMPKGNSSGPHCFYILTEWCEEGTLGDWLQRTKDMDHRKPSKICHFLNQILQALKYIHASNLAHRDLKPSNIFIQSDDNLKVGDFGSVKDMDELCLTELAAVPEPVEEDKSLSKMYGTNHYRSPELHNRCPRTQIDWKKVDIYALGVIFFEMCWPWVIPHTKRDKIFRNLLPLKAKQEPKLPDDFGDYHSDEAKQLVLSMTSFDHTVRPSIEEILKRDFHQYSEKLASSAVKEA